MVAPDRVGGPTWRALRRSSGGEHRGRLLHRAVVEHRPGRRPRSAGRTVPHVARHPGRGPGPAGGGRTGRGYDPLALARWIRRSGGAPSTSGADPIGHMLFLEHSMPEVARAARWYLEPVDYLSMRFTGVAAASRASMAGAWLTDNRRPDHLVYDPVLVKASGVPDGKLPRLVPTCSILGTVRPDVAADLGLAAGVVVMAGTPDLHSAAAGAGAVLAHQAHLAISHHQLDQLSLPEEEDRSDPPDGHRPRDPPRPQPGGQQPGVGRCRPPVVAGLPRRGDRAVVVRPVDRVGRPGPTGLRRRAVHPVAGRRTIPDRRSQGPGRVPQPVTRHDPGRLGPGRPGGVAFNSRWLSEAVERFTGRRFGSIRAIGGGATSPLWCSIFADVLDRTVEQVGDPVHANLRGSALLAGAEPRPGATR